MKLNRERIVCGLSLLILVFGIYQMLNSRLSVPAARISTDVPPFTQDIPRVEPRLYLDNVGADRNPFQLVSDWAPLTPEPLPPPAAEPSRWLQVPLGRSADPALVGFVYLKEPPVEKKSGDDEADKATPTAKDSASGGPAGPGGGNGGDSPAKPKPGPTPSDLKSKSPERKP